MARGAESKTAIFNKLTECFPGAAMVDGVFRIPMSEAGETVEIKVALTAAKDCVLAGSAAMPKEEVSFPEPKTSMSAPTQQELDDVATLMTRLGL